MPVSATRAVLRDLLRARLLALSLPSSARRKCVAARSHAARVSAHGLPRGSDSAGHPRAHARRSSGARRASPAPPPLVAERKPTGTARVANSPRPLPDATDPPAPSRPPPRPPAEVVARAKSSASRALSSVASPPASSAGPREVRALEPPPPDVGPSCDLAEEEDVQRRVIVTMEPGAVVQCTPEEQRIFDTLLDVVKRYDLPVTLRVAGGWVRDKLLGKFSSDIDIALDTMMGEEFANRVNEYLKEKGEETHGVGVIQSNPDQSKHLETATMRVHGAWLDLVNLRSESYSEGSRIPEAEFGSATDDAFRRDLTINSLFYNINLKCVEDFTGMGLEDLRAGVVRTPLPPRTTFLDDPLRILRSVRFASRFGFTLDDAIVHAATDAEVQEKLAAKVSRERVGKEVQGMLRGPSPGDALTLLCRFNLFDVVFAAALPESMTAKLPTATAWGCLHAMRSLDAVLSAHANARNEASFFTKTLTCEEREWIALASFLSPLHEGRVANTSERAANAPTRLGGKKSKSVPVVQAVVKEGLKMRGKDAEMIHATLETAEEMRDVFFRVADADAVTRVAAGRMLRKGKETWRIALVTAAVLEMPGVVVLGDGAELETWALDLARGPPCASPLTQTGGGSPLHAFAATSLGMAGPARVDDQGSVERVRAAAERLAARVRAVEDRVEAMGLDRAWEMKPLLDGRAVMETANVKGGPVMKAFTERLIDWQLENPEGTVEQATAFVREIADEVKETAGGK